MIVSLVSLLTGLLVVAGLWPSIPAESVQSDRPLAGRRIDFPGYRARADATQLEQELASVLDLMCLAIGSGATVSRALRVVVDHGPAFTALRFASLVADLDSGLAIESVLRRLPIEGGPAYQPMVTTLQTAVTHGSPVSELILRLGDEARDARRRSLEKRARQTPVLLLFPLVACSLPALIVGAVVPLIIVSV